MLRGRAITTACWILALCASGLLGLGAPAVPVQAGLLDPTVAHVGPVRVTHTAGVQDAVYGAVFAVACNPFSQNPVTSDDTVVVRLVNAPSGNAALWLRHSNAIFPAAGGTSDDTLTLADDSTGGHAIGSVNAISLDSGTGTDDTVLYTYVAANVAGTYTGTVTIYEGSEPLAAATVIQTTPFTIVTSGLPTSLKLDDTAVSLLATPNSQQRIVAIPTDAKGAHTQLSTSDSLLVASTDTTIATVTPGLMTAADFDDTEIRPLGGATFTVAGSTAPGTAQVSLTPQGTLPSGGMTTTRLPVTSAPMSVLNPTPLSVTFPTVEMHKDEVTSTDDTYVWHLNAQYVSHSLLRGTGASPGSGVIAYVSTTSDNWVDLMASGGSRSELVPIGNGSSNVPVLLEADAAGGVRLVLAWTSVDGTGDGGTITIRTGTGSATRWTAVQVRNPVVRTTTLPRGLITEKTGEAISFDVTIVDSFDNPYVGYLVSGRSTAVSGSPRGALSEWETTDSEGHATISVPAPDDSYAGNAVVMFSVTTRGYLPQSDLRPANVLVTYTATGSPTSLTVTQAQSTPSTIAPTSELTAYPHITVPYLGTASATATPGVWNASAGSGPPAGTMVTFRPNCNPQSTITATAPEGVMLSTYGRERWDSGEREVSVASGDPVYAFSTTPGTYDIEFTVGALRTTARMKVSTVPQAAYNVAISPKEGTLAPGAFGLINVFVTDPFGNRVPNTTDDTGGVTVRASGQALLTGYTTGADVTTDDSGQGLVTVIAGRSDGEATFVVSPRAGTDTPAWQSDFLAPAGFVEPVTEDSATWAIATPAVATIVISGTRGTVKGKPGVIVDGVASALPEATTLSPWLKFPGEGAYTAGTAIITPDADGEFTWQRRTGKKIYVYMRGSDGTKSRTLVIR